MRHTARRRASARSALALLLLAVSFGLAHTGASSEAEPDIADAADDQLLFGVEPACVQGTCVTGGGVDLLAVWIGNETGSQLEVHVRTSSGDHASGVAGTPATLGVDTFTVGFTLAGTAYAGTARVGSGGVEGMEPPVANATASGSLLTVVLSRAALGDPAAGSVLDGIHVLASRDDPDLPMPLVNDRAPEEDAAPVRYTFTLDSSPPGLPGNGTGPDPTSSGGSSTASGALSPSPGLPTSPSLPSTPQAPFSTGPSGGAGPGPESSRREALTSDPGYLALSAAGLVVVLATCFIGLVRWAR